MPTESHCGGAATRLRRRPRRRRLDEQRATEAASPPLAFPPPSSKSGRRETKTESPSPAAKESHQLNRDTTRDWPITSFYFCPFCVCISLSPASPHQSTAEVCGFGFFFLSCPHYGFGIDPDPTALYVVALTGCSTGSHRRI